MWETKCVRTGGEHRQPKRCIPITLQQRSGNVRPASHVALQPKRHIRVSVVNRSIDLLDFLSDWTSVDLRHGCQCNGYSTPNLPYKIVSTSSEISIGAAEPICLDPIVISFVDAESVRVNVNDLLRNKRQRKRYLSPNLWRCDLAVEAQRILINKTTLSVNKRTTQPFQTMN